MPQFTFDMRMVASITVAAGTAEQARQWLIDALEAANTNFGAYPNGDPILGEVSLADDVGPVLSMIDGEDLPDQRAEPYERVARAAGYIQSDGDRRLIGLPADIDAGRYDATYDTWRDCVVAEGLMEGAAA